MARNTFDRALSLLTNLLLIGIIVVLAMVLVEMKKWTDREKGIVIRVAENHAIDVAGTISYPLYVKALP